MPTVKKTQVTKTKAAPPAKPAKPSKTTPAKPKSNFEKAFEASPLSKPSNVNPSNTGGNPLANSISAAKEIAEHAASLRTSGAKLKSGDSAINYAQQQERSDRARENRIARESQQNMMAQQQNAALWREYGQKKDAERNAFNTQQIQLGVMDAQRVDQRVANAEQRQREQRDRDERTQRDYRQWQTQQESMAMSARENELNRASSAARQAASEAAQRRSMMLNFARGGL